jgi:signal transduction histidine kinase
VVVSNVGKGIAPEVRGRLFERFVTTRRDTGGSGLGLAIVAAVAEQHGGQVEVLDPAPGPPEATPDEAQRPRRTVFRITLPRTSPTLRQIFP